GYALNAQGVEVPGDVFLCDDFHATGEVRLSSARIGGQLACDGGRFENPDGDALNAQKARAGALLWRQVSVPQGRVNLTAAHVGDLVDDPTSWTEGWRLVLDGFTYDRISGAFTDAPSRLEWLAKGDSWDAEFFPQPYVQLAKVLREMGHERAARAVLIAMEKKVRRQIRRDAQLVPNGDVWIGLLSIGADLRNMQRWLWDGLLRIVVGYGHSPVRSVAVLIGLFLITTTLANRVWNEGSFAPNSDVILISPEWAALANAPDVANPAAAWSADGAAGQDWESFNRYAYGFDVVVPILTLGQTGAWAPSTTRGPWGYHLWWARWVLSSLGWLVTALGAAAITGIIRRE
ncbi:MAG: hypothetical protein WBN04_13795, partial [Paracoccaceae bacterium]